MEQEQRPLWTKFICSLGPASESPEVIEGLIKAGANVLRSNFAHASYDEYRSRKAIVEDINRRLGTTAKIQADIQGPNIRLGDIPEPGLPIEAGEEYWFYTAAGEPGSSDDILINDQTLHMDVKVGEPITFMDGALEGEITALEGHRLKVRMINSAMLRRKKSINVPETKLSSSAITDKDRKDIEFLCQEGVDYLAISFIGSAADVNEVRQLVGDRPIKLISKIERREAIKNIVEIIDASDGIMIARGDLGIELPMEEIPILSRTISSLCEHAGKPVITATQMLYTLTKSRRPTRAEVSDVANAVFNRSDALMLSEETNEGVDPVNALQTMVRIARRAEEYMYGRPNFFDTIWR